MVLLKKISLMHSCLRLQLYANNTPYDAPYDTPYNIFEKCFGTSTFDIFFSS